MWAKVLHTWILGCDVYSNKKKYSNTTKTNEIQERQILELVDFLNVVMAQRESLNQTHFTGAVIVVICTGTTRLTT